MSRTLSVIEVAQLLRNSLDKAFECKIEFATKDDFFATFYVKGEDVLSIRVTGEDYWLATCERPQAPSLLKLSKAMKNAVGLAAVLQLKARWDFEDP